MGLTVNNMANLHCNIYQCYDDPAPVKPAGQAMIDRADAIHLKKKL